jgi:chromate transport protein ChrA
MDALRFWFKLGFISFGGPTGQIAIMHTELVERRRWISEARFLHALNYCMLLPGPGAALSPEVSSCCRPWSCCGRSPGSM